MIIIMVAHVVDEEVEAVQLAEQAGVRLVAETDDARHAGRRRPGFVRGVEDDLVRLRQLRDDRLAVVADGAVRVEGGEPRDPHRRLPRAWDSGAPAPRAPGRRRPADRPPTIPR